MRKKKREGGRGNIRMLRTKGVEPRRRTKCIISMARIIKKVCSVGMSLQTESVWKI